MDHPPVQPHVTARPPRRQFDSSRTRVGPVFGALAATVSDDQWVRGLLDLAADRGDRRWHTQDLRVIERHHHAPPGADTPKEKGLAPPDTLLAWLLDHFTRPKGDKYGSGEVGDMRRLLAEGDADTMAKARAGLARSRRGKAWYILEGQTSPDVYLVTRDALIVVEGKRTEAGPTTSTTWMAGRHQMLRHIDAAWEIRGDRSVYGMFIVEALPGTDDVPELWQQAAKDTCSDAAIQSSLPHRSLADQEGIRRAMVGVTTWQRIVSTFHLPPSVLQ
jgi:hypothetical protein